MAVNAFPVVSDGNERTFPADIWSLNNVIIFLLSRHYIHRNFLLVEVDRQYTFKSSFYQTLAHFLAKTAPLLPVSPSIGVSTKQRNHEHRV